MDRRAVAFFEEMIGEFARIGEEGGSASLAELFAARLEREPVMVDYVRRLLLDEGEAADALFAELFEATVAGMRSRAEAGVVRPAQDEQIRTAFLLANDLSLVPLRRQIARVTGPTRCKGKDWFPGQRRSWTSMPRPAAQPPGQSLPYSRTCIAHCRAT